MEIISQLALQSINGLVWGMLIALIALGLALVFGLTEIINIAHGELYMLGAVFGWYLIDLTGSFWVALVVAPLIVGCIGALVERSVLRPMEHKPELTIIVTFGLAMILQYSVLAIFGGAPKRVVAPIDFTFTMFGRGYPSYRLFTAAFAGTALLSLWLFLSRTRLGLWMRAVRQDREMALVLGIPVPFVYMATFGLGSALAALAGVLASPIVAVEFKMGLDILPIAFMAVIVGGMSDLRGTLVAALLIGLLEGVCSVFASPIVARILSLLLISMALLFRPQGLLTRTE